MEDLDSQGIIELTEWVGPGCDGNSVTDRSRLGEDTQNKRNREIRKEKYVEYKYRIQKKKTDEEHR